MVDVRMTMDEYLTLLGGLTDAPSDMSPAATEEMPKKKRSSAYSRRYKANFRKVAPRFKLKNGKWKKNGFKSAVKLAHKMSKK
ncbi:unnamed protein product [marine sediment metagenome]|uniref:Uncharacterized protein n=1 Tax=marine sediment metagenome TaxID=412755 RepID=X1S2G5_9ZZZZ